MWTDCPAINPDIKVSDIVYKHILHTGRRCFPVLRNTHVAGIITIHNIKSVPREKWNETTATDIMTPLDSIQSVTPETPLGKVMDMMTAEGYNQVPVEDKGVFAGMVSRETLMDFLKAKKDLGI